MVASVANKFCDSDIVFAVANEEDYPDDLRYDAITSDASHLQWEAPPPQGPGSVRMGGGGGCGAVCSRTTQVPHDRGADERLTH